jgi:DNA-binding MarR family transcriptional regulator
MAGPDEIIHQSLRLRIMATLYAQRTEGALEFTRLRALLEATDGNLGSHLATLEKAGYLAVEKDFVGKRPRTRVTITAAGASAFRDHTAFLRDVLDSAG